MSVGFGAANANAMLDNAFATVWVQLHVGDPGANGTANIATEADRVQATMGAAASGVKSNSAPIQWTNVDGAEDYTHLSLWSAQSGGTFLGSGVMTANAVQVGDTFTIPTGDLDISLIVAA